MASKRDLMKQTKQELADQLAELEEKLKNQPKKTETEQREETTRATTVRQAVAGLSAEKVAQDLAAVSVSLSNQLAKVSENLVGETRRLDEVREAVALETAELERLHGKDVAASALEHLVLEYREREAHLKEQQTEAQKKWIREQQERQQIAQEEAEQVSKERERDQAEYAYQLKQQRQTENDRWQDHLRQRNIEEEERKRALERNWNEREEFFKKQEHEFAELRAKVSEFPTLLETETKKKVAEVSGAISSTYKHEIALLTKDKQTAEQIAQAQIRTLSEQITQANAENQKLREQIAKVDERVQQIASAAITEAGASKALSELRAVTRVPGDNGSAPPRRT